MSSFLLYSGREGFDYLRYLEERSHSEEIILAVESGIRRLSASDQEIAEYQGGVAKEATSSIIGELENIGDAVELGFDRVNFNLELLRDDIQDLSAICENGFRGISNSFQQLSKNISELIELLKSPEQTWALEQHRNALKAFHSGWNVEALGFANKSINGDQNNAGYKLEPNFYFLRGMIYFGDYSSYDKDLINLDAAKSDFESALRYSKGQSSKVSQAHNLLGWLYLAQQRDIGMATISFQKATQENPMNGDAWFGLSKVKYASRQPDEGSSALIEALKVDKLYSIRSGADPDMLTYASEVTSVIDEYRKSLIDWVNSLRRTCDEKLGATISILIDDVYPFPYDAPRLNGVEEIKNLGSVSRLEASATLMSASKAAESAKGIMVDAVGSLDRAIPKVKTMGEGYDKFNTYENSEVFRKREEGILEIIKFVIFGICAGGFLLLVDFGSSFWEFDFGQFIMALAFAGGVFWLINRIVEEVFKSRYQASRELRSSDWRILQEFKDSLRKVGEPQ